MKKTFRILKDIEKQNKKQGSQCQSQDFVLWHTTIQIHVCVSEAPDAYVQGSILAYWELCIATGLQMEYGMRPRMHMCQGQYLRTGS